MTTLENRLLISANVLLDYIQKVEAHRRKIVKYFDIIFIDKSLGIYVSMRTI